MNKTEETENIAGKVAMDVWNTMHDEGVGGLMITKSRRVAEVLTEKYVMIDRAELPETSVVRHNDSEMVGVIGSIGAWEPKTANAASTRKRALQYLAVAEALEAYVPEPAPISLYVPANSTVQCTGHPTQKFSDPGTFTYTPRPGTAVIITNH